MKQGNLYDDIGIKYNSTRQADPYIVNRLFDLLEPKQNGHYLDIGCGTGNYTIALASMGITFSGIDPSNRMLSKAKNKSASINWINGTAENIPLPDCSFDGTIATLTIHHWENIEKSFVELFRVLKSKSNLVIFTALPQQMEGYWLNHYFPQMLKMSITKMPSIEQMEKASLKAGFRIASKEKYFIQMELKDLFLYSGKHRPEIYFNDSVRKGISSFASLSNKEEVDEGLKILRRDIAIGEFERVKKKFENDLGDYFFLTLEKLQQ